jgi:2-polyprenyl-6-methoxyphenol hydroxylase-like FAD-dependent oxidoreductase
VRYAALRGGRFGIGIHRAALFDVLFRAVQAEGIAIESGLDLAALDATGGAATLATVDGRRLGGFDLVVDATGARSRLRREALSPSEPRPLAYGAFWASLGWCGDGFDEHALLQRYDKASVMIGVLPIGRPSRDAGPTAAFFWSLKPAEVETVLDAGLTAWKDRIAGLWPQCEPYLDQIDDFEQLSLARYGHHTLARPVGRRLAVIGDAAHSTSPQLGQGANMALLDARALAQALTTGRTIEDALAAYARMRRLHVRTFQALSWMLTPFYQSDSTVLPFLRDRLVASIARIPPAPQFLAAMVAGTVIDPFARIGLAEVDWHRPAAATASTCG